MGTILRYVRARRHAFRTFAHRLLASGERAHRFVQLPLGAKERRAIHFAHRGHGCRAERCASPRGAHRGVALARARVGRGAGGRRSERALPAVRARRLVSGAVRPLGVRRARLPLLLHARGARARAQARAHGGQAAALYRHLPRPDRRRARRAAGAGTEAHAPFRRPRRDGHRVHRSRARTAALLVGRHRRLHRSSRGRHGRVLFLQRRGRFRHGRHPRVARRRSSHQYAAPVDAARCTRHAATRLRPRRPAGRRGRRAAVEAARQHERAGVPRARLPAGGAPQSSVPLGAHGRRRRLACARSSCPRTSVRSISAARRRASRSRSSCTGRRRRCGTCRPPRSPSGSACRTRRRSSSSCATTWCFPRTRSPGCPWCAASCRRSAPRSSVSSPPRGPPSSRPRRRHWIDRARICTRSPPCSSKRPGEAARSSSCLCGWRSPARPTDRSSLRILKLMPLETARRRLESHARDT